MNTPKQFRSLAGTPRRHRTSVHSRGRSLVAYLVAVVLPTMGLVATQPTLPAQAQAGTGTGRLVNQIEWADFGAPGRSVGLLGTSGTTTRTVAGSTIATTCRIGLSAGSLETYRPSGKDILSSTYNTTAASGVRKVGILPSAVFTVSCTATVDGNPVPTRGLVVAQAQAFAQGDNASITATPGPDLIGGDSMWRVLDRDTTCASTVSSFATPVGSTLDLFPSAGHPPCPNGGPGVVALIPGSSAAAVTLTGGPTASLSFGVILETDFGDAPASYGEAASLMKSEYVKGVIPTDVRAWDIFTGNLGGVSQTTLTLSSPTTNTLGTIADSELSARPSQNAEGDDAANTSPGITISDEDAMVSGQDTPPLRPDGTYSRTLTCTGTGYINGWFDFDRNGTFEANEKSSEVRCTNQTATLTWTLDDSLVSGATFIRLRSSSTPGAGPTGLTLDGEVEDHNVTVVEARPVLELTKTATVVDADGDGLADAGETIAYSFTVANTGPGDATAVMISDPQLGVNNQVCANNLAAGATVTCPTTPSHVVTLAEAGSGSYHNTATVSATARDGATITDDGIAATSTDDRPQISLDITAPGRDVQAVPLAGEVITFRYTVTNTGSVAVSNVVITDPRLGLIDAPCLTGTLDPGATGYCEKDYTVTAYEIFNQGWGLIDAATAAATASGPESGGESATAQDWILLGDSARSSRRTIVQIDDTDGDGLGDVGESVTVHLITFNNSDTRAAAQGCATSVPAHGYVICSQTVTINQAIMDSQAEPWELNGDTAVGFRLDRYASLTMIKTPDRDVLIAGETLTYTFTVTNTGSTTLLATVTDALVGLDAAPCGEVAPGATITCVTHGLYTVTSDDVQRGHLENTATVNAVVLNAAEPLSTSASASVSVPQNPKPAMTLTPIATITDLDGDGLADAGETIVYSFAVTNTGNVTLTDVILTESGLGQSNLVCADQIVPGATVQCQATIAYVVTDADVAAGSVSTSATVTANEPAGEVLTLVEATSTPTDNRPALLLDITTPDRDPALAVMGGEIITFRYTITNTGVSPISDITLADTRLGFVDEPCVAGPLAPGETAFCEKQYTVSTYEFFNGGYGLIDAATATGTNPSGVTTADQAWLLIGDSAGDDHRRSIVKIDDTDGDGLGDVGELATYHLVYFNPGTTDIVLDSAQMCQGTVPAQGYLECSAAEEIPQFYVDESPTIWAHGNAGMEFPPIGMYFDRRVGLSFEKRADKTTLVAGETITYTFIATNTGTTNLGVNFTDPKLGITLGCGYLEVGATKTCFSNASYVVTQEDVDYGRVVNTATATAEVWSGSFPDVVTAPAVAVVPEVSNPELVLSSAATLNDADGDGLADAGESVTYDLTVTNAGDVRLTGVTVTDPGTGAAVVCAETLNVGQTGTCSITYTVTDNDINTGAVLSSLVATAIDIDDDAVTAPAAENAIPADSAVGSPRVPTESSAGGNQGEPVTVAIDLYPGMDPGSIRFPSDGQPEGAVIGADGTRLTVPNEGTWLASPDGSLLFTPVDGLAGDPTSIQIVAADAQGNVAVTPGVVTVNYPDVPDIVSGTSEPRNPVTVEVSLDSDMDPTTVKYPATNQPVGAIVSSDGKTLTVPDQGVWTIDEAGNLTFTPALGFEGDPTPVAFTATDLAGNLALPGQARIDYNQAPALEVTKTADLNDLDDDGVADIGETVTYSFVIKNTGNVALQQVSVTDDKLGMVGLACVPTVAAGATANCATDVQYTVTQADVDSGAVSNSATAAGVDPTGAVVASTPSEGGSNEVPGDTSSGIVLEKTGSLRDADGDGLADVGETITYSFAVTNTGSVTVAGVTVSDPKAGLVDGRCVDSLGSGETADCAATVDYVVTQADVDSGTVANQAVAAGTSPDGTSVASPESGEGAGFSEIMADTTAGVALVKSGVLVDGDGDGRADAGETVTYSFSVTNTGRTTLTAVTVTDAKLGVQGIACVDSLAPGETAECSATVAYSVTQADVDSGAVSNSATATGRAPDGAAVASPESGAGSGSSEIPVDFASSLELVKTGLLRDGDGDGLADVGETITYTFSVINVGTTTVTAVTVTDTKAGLIDAPCVVSVAPGDTVVCATTVEYLVTQADVDAGTVANTATAAGRAPNGSQVVTPHSGPGAGVSEIAADRVSRVVLSSGSVLRDGDGDGLADVGETISYTFTVTNAGTATLAPVTVSDAGLGLVAAACVASLAPGDSAECVATVDNVVTQADVDAGSVTNSATASGVDPAGVATVSEPSSADVVRADQTAGLVLVKSGTLQDADGDGRADVGETVRYSFAVTNSGLTTLTSVVVADAKLGVQDLVCGGTVAPGDTAECATTVVYVVTQADVDSGAVSNSATAAGVDPTGAVVASTPSEGGSNEVPGDTSSGLSLAKSGALNDADGDGLADVGETITYSFAVTNTGSVTVAGVTVSDPKAGLVDGRCVDSLGSGETADCAATVDYVVTQADVDSGTVSNSATATGQAPDGGVVASPESGVGSGGSEIPVDSSAGLSVVLAAALIDDDGDGLADRGELITYSFSVTNTGTTTVSSVVLDGAGLSGASCAVSVAPGDTVVCATTVDYLVTQADVDAGTVANTATVAGVAPDGSSVLSAVSEVSKVAADRVSRVVLSSGSVLRDGDGDNLADVGETISYTYTVTNTGTTTLAPVTVSEAATGLVAAACVASLAPGESVVCSTTVDYVVTQADVDAGSVTNTATASGVDPAGIATVSEPSTASPVGTDQTSTLALVKTGVLNDGDGDGRADVGETVTYSFSVTNTGRTTLTALTVTDAKLGVQDLVCGDAVAPGETAECATTVDYVVTQADVDSGSVSNAATASGSAPTGATVTSPETGSGSGESEIPVDSASGLSLAKSGVLKDGDGDGRADVGETVTYSFSVTNSGKSTLTGVTVTDAKAGLADVACATSLAPGETAVCATTVDYSVTQADVDSGTVANSATAEGRAPDGSQVSSPTFGPGAGVSEIAVDSSAGLAVASGSVLRDGDGDGLADVGETISYTFTVTNTGTTTLAPVTVTDPRLGLVAAACVASLAPGESAVCATTVDYSVTQADVDSGSVTNSATASGVDPAGVATVSEPSSASPVGTDQTSTLVLVKTGVLNDGDGDGRADVGETITYSFSVTNSGKSTLTGVTVTDAKAGLADAACVASLAPGESAVCATTVDYSVTQADVDSGSVSNSASASGSAPNGEVVSSPESGAGSGGSEIPVDSTSGITVASAAALQDSDSDGLADVGETITYTVSVTNTGTTTLAPVTITDPRLGLVAAACVAKLAPGESAVCATTVDYSVTQADVDSGSVTNSATASGVDPAGVATVSEPSWASPVGTDQTSTVALVKTGVLNDSDGDGRADVGETIIYSFSVTNTGRTTLTAVAITDAKLGVPGLACVTSLAPGETAVCATTVDYVVTQADVDSGSVSNAATASGSAPNGEVVSSPESGAGSGGSEIPVDSTSGITVALAAALQDSDSDGLADVGETITYTVSVTNTGTTTLAPVVIDGLGLTDAACGASLAPGETAVCATTVDYLVTQADVDAGTVAHTLSATATLGDGSTVTARSTASEVPTDRSPSLSVATTAVLNDTDADNLADVGETITYTFTVTNTGTTTLAPVTVSEAATGLVAAACVASLAPGESAVCATTVDYSVTQADVDAGSVTNNATASGVDPAGVATVSEPSSASPVGTDQTSTVALVKSGVLNDSDGDGRADVGETVTYSFSVTNTGRTTLTAVAITDAKLGVPGLACVGSLAPGETAVCATTVDYSVTQADVDSGSVTNAATASGSAPNGEVVSSPESGAGSGGSEIPVDSTSGITVALAASLQDSDSDGLADVGETITYTVSVTNTGTTTMSPVVIDGLGLTEAACAAKLAPGDSAVCATTVDYLVTQADVDAGTVAHTLSATATLGDGSTVTARSTASEVPTDRSPSLSVATTAVLNDTDADNLADVGETITYTFTVTNTGTTTLAPVTVTNAATDVVDAVCVASLAPGESAVCAITVDYSVTQADVDAGTVNNSSTAAGTSPTGAAVSGTESPATGAQTPTDRRHGIELTSAAGLGDSDGDGLADAGETITYTYTVTNSGTTTLGPVTLSDSATGVADSACVATLAPGQSARCAVTVEYSVTQADVDSGAVSNNPSATGLAPDGTAVTTPATGAGATVVGTDRSRGLTVSTTAALTDSDGDNLADRGEMITATFAVTNTGATTLAPVMITIPSTGQTITCAATLSPGESVTCPSPVEIAATQAQLDSGLVSVSATASATAPDGTTVLSAQSTAEVTTDSRPAISMQTTAALQDSDGDRYADAGEVIVYTFAVTNTGTTTVGSITINDSKLGLVELSCVETVSPEATALCSTTVSYIVTAADVHAGSVSTSSSATGTAPDGTVVATPADGPGSGRAEVPVDSAVGSPRVPATVTGSGEVGAEVRLELLLDPGMDQHSVVFPAQGQPDGAIVAAGGKTMSVPGQGVWSVTEDGDLVFTPENDFSGDPAPILFTAADMSAAFAAPGTAMVTYPRVPGEVTGAGTPGQPVTLLVELGVAMDRTSLAFPVEGQPAGATVSTDGTTLSVPGQGVWSTGRAGELLFTPELGLTSDPTPVLFTAADERGHLSLPGKASVDYPQVPAEVSGISAIGATVTIPLDLSQGMDRASVRFPAAGQPSGAVVSPDGTSVTIPAQGVWSVTDDGDLIFAPAEGFAATSTPVLFNAADVAGHISLPGRVSVSYPQVPTVEVAGEPGTVVRLTPTLSDTMDRTTVRFTLPAEVTTTADLSDATLSPDGRTLTVPGEGVWTVGPDGDLIFTPEIGFELDPTPVNYQAADTANNWSLPSEAAVDYDQRPSVEVTGRAELLDTDGDGLADVGERIRYSITIVNDGNVSTTQVKVHDQLLDLPPTVCASRLSPGKTVTYTVAADYVVTEEDLIVGEVLNTMWVSETTYDGSVLSQQEEVATKVDLGTEGAPTPPPSSPQPDGPPGSQGPQIPPGRQPEDGTPFLPGTGGPAAGIALAGVVMLVSGGALLLVRRRVRRSRY